jgi:hypothetical protein
MSTLQAVIFGMMLSWTPSIVLLAFLLWRERIGLPEDLNSKSKSPAKFKSPRGRIALSLIVAG